MKIGQFTFTCQRFLIALAIASFLSLVFINPVMTQEQVLRTLTVTGQGVERIPTTLTKIQLGVEIQGKTATEVQKEVAKRTSAVVDFLRSRKVDRLQTTGIRLQPNYQYSNNKRSLVGYIGMNTVSFRLQTEQVGALLDETVKAGATRIDGVSFTATEEAISAAQKQALRQATTDAQQQADAVLGALNFTAKEVVSIQVGKASVPSPQQMATGGAGGAGVSTPVFGGEQSVRASVALQISY